MLYTIVVAIIVLIGVAAISWVGMILYAVFSALFEKDHDVKVTVAGSRKQAVAPRPQRIDYGNGMRLGRYTAGAYGDALTLAAGGRSEMFCRLVIAYADAKEDVTSRIIDVMAFSTAATPDGEVVPYNLEAFCELRKAKRNFRADRILECAIANTGEGVSDLMSVLLSAPQTVAFERKTAILHTVDLPPVILEYQFRAPTFKRVTVKPEVIGYSEESNGDHRNWTLLFVDGMMEGKTERQRFKAERIQQVWIADHEAGIDDMSRFFLADVIPRENA
ncbi:hypothetical protein K2X14_07805 [Acetobacter sp. TBRC 12305]|uniref:Uncharacterized protein n=1 Tax=Acetobacter garciniae TaxID=2817435 RepID=A0A939HQ26_9PROT|nr:hypothetical protein [Acetobacter garciniae]MBO1325291.1 hypothetical protein [Acetobacter garciniae]MBX0344737.1 hypothetical protein [Acetobacter garciniae]